jgi:predicted DNA binding CopG/RHH family protein
MKKKIIPKFKNEEEERKFWESADSTEYVDWKKAEKTLLPYLKPSLKKVSLRLPELMISELKQLANKRDVPYQSLMKVFLAERIQKELKQNNTAQ